MAVRYYVGPGIGQEKFEVTREEYIKAERAAGFRPKISGDHPAYMKTVATSSFGGNNLDGEIRRIKLSDTAAVNQYMNDLIGKAVELGRDFDEISEVGAYAEPGMKMRVTKFEWDDGEIARLWFDQAEFLDENRKFESSDFIQRDKNGSEITVDAHAAGEYKPEDYYLLEFERFEDYFSILREEPGPAPTF